MIELGQHECLPRLLDLDSPPPLGRQRWYWRYPWYSTFIRLPGKISRSGRLMSARITAGSGFALICDPKLLAHNSVVVLTPLDDGVDLHYLLGVLNSKVFSRYVSLPGVPRARMADR